MVFDILFVVCLVAITVEHPLTRIVGEKASAVFMCASAIGLCAVIAAFFAQAI